MRDTYEIHARLAQRDDGQDPPFLRGGEVVRRVLVPVDLVELLDAAHLDRSTSAPSIHLCDAVLSILRLGLVLRLGRNRAGSALSVGL